MPAASLRTGPLEGGELGSCADLTGAAVQAHDAPVDVLVEEGKGAPIMEALDGGQLLSNQGQDPTGSHERWWKEGSAQAVERVNVLSHEKHGEAEGTLIEWRRPEPLVH